jgi:hypothetical protein
MPVNEKIGKFDGEDAGQYIESQRPVSGLLRTSLFQPILNGAKGLLINENT